MYIMYIVHIYYNTFNFLYVHFPLTTSDLPTGSILPHLTSHSLCPNSTLLPTGCVLPHLTSPWPVKQCFLPSPFPPLSQKLLNILSFSHVDNVPCLDFSSPLVHYSLEKICIVCLCVCLSVCLSLSFQNSYCIHYLNRGKYAF